MWFAKRSYSKYWQNCLPEWNLGFSKIKCKTHRDNGLSSQTPVLTRCCWGRLKIKCVTRMQLGYFRTSHFYSQLNTFRVWYATVPCYCTGSHVVVLMFENTPGLEICPFSPPLQSWGMNWICKQTFIDIVRLVWHWKDYFSIIKVA